MADFKATGSCLCGGVAYEYTTCPSEMVSCHCSMCRKSIGAPYGVYVCVDDINKFHLIKKDTLSHYQSSENVIRSFCGTCGGGVFASIVKEPNKVWLIAGTIDGDPGVTLKGHMHVKDKAPWVTINDGLPSLDE